MNASPDSQLRRTARVYLPALFALFTFLQIFVCQEARSMEALKSSRYFADPAVAAFVDDVQRGDVSRVKQGLAAGISANAPGSDGFRPIHFAFVSPKADVLRELLAAGADPNAKLSNGNTPLHFAVRMPNPDFTSVLLAAKADPNAKGDNDKPVFHAAIDYPGTRVLELLLKAGADINAPWGGGTPLVNAVTGTSWDTAAFLIAKNADLSWRDKGGYTAADWWCRRLARTPVNERTKASVSALAAAFAARGVELSCAAEVARFR